MPKPSSKIYTRQGDQGETTLGRHRRSKDDHLVEAIGNLDELNAHIGMVIALNTNDPDINLCLTQIQNDLFDLGGELHMPEFAALTSARVTYLEQQLDQWDETLPPLNAFILPGGNPAAAACHIARTVCRRTERSLVHTHQHTALLNNDILCYINRLSDLLFVIARVLARQEGIEDKIWQHSINKETR